MKKLLLIFFFNSLLSLAGYSQNYLTVGQVYNFNVGDVFEVECGSSASLYPPAYTLTTVLAKWYSAKKDTVFYKDSGANYQLPSCMTCVGSFSAAVDTTYYTNLNSRALQDTNVNDCPAVWDSIYVSAQYCGQKVWEQGPSQSCLDTLPVTFDGHNTEYSWLIEGCGGPYTNVYFEGNPAGNFCSLVYYKKHDTICGTEYIITGVDQLTVNNEQLKVFPNPTTGVVNFVIANGEKQSQLDVYNVMGEKVYNAALRQVQGDMQIDLSNEPNGIYLYRITDNKGSLLKSGKLIIQK